MVRTESYESLDEFWDRFDPFKEIIPDSDEPELDALLADEDEFLKHLGPGNHPDGSPQKVHGRKRGGRLGNEIDRRGGYTYQPMLMSSPTSGYVVSIWREKTHVFESRAEATREALNAYIDEHWDFVEDDKRRHFGAWVDSEDGKVHLDVVVVLGDRSSAEQVGRDGNEKAIWDLERGEEIRL